MFDYHCKCGFDFFEEEGYNGELDTIICPMCGATRYGDEDDYIIEETKGVMQMRKISLHATEITEEQINKAIQCLIENGIDEDDAYEILTALGYILLDEELFPDD